MTVEREVSSRPAWLGDEAMDRREAAGLAVIVVGFFAVAGAALWLRSPLGHDESVYALRSRDLAGGWSNLSGVYWADYRAPGLPVFLRLAHGFGDIHVTSARVVVVILGASAVVGTWWLGRLLAGRVVGLIAATLTASTLGFVVSSTTLLADVPGAAFVLPAVACYLVELRSGVLRWSFLVVPALAFLGTFARFGVPLMLASGLIAVSLPSIVSAVRRRSWTLCAQVAILALSVGLTCALVLLTEFVALSGTTPVDANRALIGRKGLTVATGFADLGEVVNPWVDDRLPKLWSANVATLFLAGAILAVVGAAVSRVRRDAVVVSFVAAVVSVFAIVASVGLVVANYLVLSLPFWAILAGIGLAWPIRAIESTSSFSSSSSAGRLVIGAVFAVIVSLLFVDVGRATRDQHRQYDLAFGRIRSASVGVDLAFAGCFLVTSYTPQVGYYSRCKVVPFITSEVGAADDERETSVLDASLPASLDRGRRLFDVDEHVVTGVFVVESGKRQPPDADFGTSELLDEERLFERGVDGEGRRHAWVQLLEP